MMKNKFVKWTNDCSNENTENEYTQIKVIREKNFWVEYNLSSLKKKLYSIIS